MSFLRDWLLGMVAAALAVALAQALTPEGAGKRAVRLVGGLLLLLVIAKPLGGLASVRFSLPAVPEAAEGEWAPGGEEVRKTLIAQKTGAYIVDKGSALGCRCQAAVTVAEDGSGWSVPWSAELTGAWTPEQKRALSGIMAEELGIPRERQSFVEEVP